MLEYECDEVALLSAQEIPNENSIILNVKYQLDRPDFCIELEKDNTLLSLLEGEPVFNFPEMFKVTCRGDVEVFDEAYDGKMYDVELENKVLHGYGVIKPKNLDNDF